MTPWSHGLSSLCRNNVHLVAGIKQPLTFSCFDCQPPRRGLANPCEWASRHDAHGTFSCCIFYVTLWSCVYRTPCFNMFIRKRNHDTYADAINSITIECTELSQSHEPHTIAVVSSISIVDDHVYDYTTVMREIDKVNYLISCGNKF